MSVRPVHGLAGSGTIPGPAASAAIPTVLPLHTDETRAWGMVAELGVTERCTAAGPRWLHIFHLVRRYRLTPSKIYKCINMIIQLHNRPYCCQTPFPSHVPRQSLMMSPSITSSGPPPGKAASLPEDKMFYVLNPIYYCKHEQFGPASRKEGKRGSQPQRIQAPG